MSKLFTNPSVSTVPLLENKRLVLSVLAFCHKASMHRCFFDLWKRARVASRRKVE
jgi:hypothetical protein